MGKGLHGEARDSREVVGASEEGEVSGVSKIINKKWVPLVGGEVTLLGKESLKVHFSPSKTVGEGC